MFRFNSYIFQANIFLQIKLRAEGSKNFQSLVLDNSHKLMIKTSL